MESPRKTKDELGLAPGERLGLISGNGRFPFLILKTATKRGIPLCVVGIREETFPELEREALAKGPVQHEFHWIGLGQLGKLIRTFRDAGVGRAIMAGQVQHRQIFAPHTSEGRKLLTALPDLKMLSLLSSLRGKNTESLIGGVVAFLAKEGIQLLDSTVLLAEDLAPQGILSSRKPDKREREDIRFAQPIARQLTALDIGQTLVVSDRAVVAVEAMEGTDETIQRASRLTGGRPLTVIKASRPSREMRFDVPVVGLNTLSVFQENRVTALALDAGRTLILNREEFLQKANQLKIAIVSEE